MSNYCPKINSYVTYMYCQECDNKICQIASEDIFYLLVAGTRTYEDYKELSNICDYMLSNITRPVCIISGGANGADKLAERYAKEHGYQLKIFPAKWDLYGKRAGMVRNQQMHNFIARYPHRAVLCFWDGKSRGTKSNFQMAKDKGTRIATWSYIKKQWVTF